MAALENQLTIQEYDSYKSELNYKLAKEKDKATKTSESKLKRDRNVIKCRYIAVDTNVIPKTEVIVNTRKALKPRRKRKKHTVSAKNRRRSEIKGVIPQITTISEGNLKSCVINLSTKVTEISQHQLYLFYLGKSFAPTPPLPDYSKFRLDILQFAYKLRWAWYWFCNTPKTQKDMSSQELAIKLMEMKLIKSEETKPIKVTNNHCLELYIERITKDLLQTNTRIRSKLPDNLPTESRLALEEMQKWKDIVIRPADKGSKYFFLDREDYVKRVQVHIYDQETFQKVNKDEAEKQTRLEISKWCYKYEHTNSRRLNWIMR